MRKAIAWLSVPVVLAWSALAAAAPPRSLGAAEASLPADVDVVASANLKTLRSTQLYARSVTPLLTMGGDAREGLAKVRQGCGIDPEKAIDDVTVAVGQRERGAVFIALSGVSEKQLVECVARIAQQETSEAITSSKSGLITELGPRGSSKKLYFAWLPGDVLAMATEPDDKALLERMLGGKGALRSNKSLLRLKAHDPESALLVGFTKKIPGSGLDLKSGSLGVRVVAGKVSAESQLETGSKEEAEQIAAATKVLGMMVGLPKDAPKQLHALLKSIDAKAHGPEVKIVAQASEADLVAIIDWALKSQGIGTSSPTPKRAVPPGPPGKSPRP